MRPINPALRFPLLAAGILALLAGMWAGLVRLGWPFPAVRPTLPMAHGPLMVAGFLGTLVSLERAVALERRWAYAAPLAFALGGLSLIAGWPGGFWAPLLMTLGGLGMVAIFAVIVRRQPAPFTVVMALGAVALLAGNAMWLAGRPVYSAVLWWMGFLVLTIVGERLEMSRLLRLSRASRAAFLAATAVLLAGIIAGAVVWDLGMRIAGVGMVALAVWLLRYDIARRTVRQAGLTRFIAASLLSGYVWLGVGGLLAMWLGGVVAGPAYDAILHAVFLGFVMAMIFGHAPIIFPAVLRLPITYRPAFYAHLALLHLSLVLRVGSDLAGWTAGREWGGLLNVVAVLLFLGSSVWSMLPVSRAQPNFGEDRRKVLRASPR